VVHGAALNKLDLIESRLLAREMIACAVNADAAGVTTIVTLAIARVARSSNAATIVSTSSPRIPWLAVADTNVKDTRFEISPQSRP
jgi:hypothetical protein